MGTSSGVPDFAIAARKIWVRIKAKSEGECGAIEQKMRGGLNLGIQNGDRKGSAPCKAPLRIYSGVLGLPYTRARHKN